MNQLPSAGKHQPGARRGKTSTGCQARENTNRFRTAATKTAERQNHENIGTRDVQINYLTIASSFCFQYEMKVKRQLKKSYLK